MPTTLDMSLDYLTWDNTTSVTYESARARASIVDVVPVYDGETPAPEPPPSTNVSYDIAVAKRRALTWKELETSGGVYTSGDLVWLIPDALFPAGVLSKPADVIVEKTAGANQEQPGTRWTVLEVLWGKNRWTRRLVTRNLVLAADLRDTITIERPKITYDAAGVALKQFPSDNPDNPVGVVTYADLPARVQLVSEPETDELGMRGSQYRYKVFLDRDINVTREDRVKLPSGLYLDILSYEGFQSINNLSFLECRRKL